MPNWLRSLFSWLKRRRPAFLRPSVDSGRVQRAIEERVAKKPESIPDQGFPGVRIGTQVEANLAAIRELLGNAPDLVMRDLRIAGSFRAAVAFLTPLAARKWWRPRSSSQWLTRPCGAASRFRPTWLG